MKTFRGLFPSLITPFHPDGRLNEQGLRDHIDFVIANGADGFCGGSSTGEFMNLTRAEWERVLVITADQNRGRVPMLAGKTDMADVLAFRVVNNPTAALPLAVLGRRGAVATSGLASRWRSRLPVGEPHSPDTPTPQDSIPLGEISFRNIDPPTPNQP